MLNRKNRLFNNYKRHGYKAEDKLRLDAFRIECQQVVETAKLSYLTNLGNKVNNPGTSQKSYWKIINRVMNKCRAPKIPPLLVNNLFILNCKEKARYFNDYFSQQCNPVISNRVLPILLRSLKNVTNNLSKIIDRYHFSLFVEMFLKRLFSLIFTSTYIQTIL